MTFLRTERGCTYTDTHGISHSISNAAYGLFLNVKKLHVEKGWAGIQHSSSPAPLRISLLGTADFGGDTIQCISMPEGTCKDGQIVIDLMNADEEANEIEKLSDDLPWGSAVAFGYAGEFGIRCSLPSARFDLIRQELESGCLERFSITVNLESLFQKTEDIDSQPERRNWLWVSKSHELGTEQKGTVMDFQLCSLPIAIPPPTNLAESNAANFYRSAKRIGWCLVVFVFLVLLKLK